MKKFKKKILAIIPARSGSKGIKNKNIVKINNKPLIFYTIKNAKNSNMISDLIGSTDSEKIKKIFEKYKVQVPFLRPKKLSTDKSLIVDTLIFCLKKMEKIKQKKYDYIILLQPTAPNRSKKEIDKCINKIIRTNADSLISLSPLDEPHPLKLKTISKGVVQNYLKSAKNNFPRQSLPKLYKPSGNVYIFTRKILLNRDLKGKKQICDLISSKNHLNIDTKDDLILAKIKLRAK